MDSRRDSFSSQLYIHIFRASLSRLSYHTWFRQKDTENNIIGWSLALGEYKTDIGTQGTNVESNNVSLSGYGSIKLNEELIIEPIVGYSHLNFDTSRKDQLQTLTGSRNAQQFFTSIKLKNTIKSADNKKLNISPYGNIYAAWTEFDKIANPADLTQSLSTIND